MPSNCFSTAQTIFLTMLRRCSGAHWQGFYVRWCIRPTIGAYLTILQQDGRWLARSGWVQTDAVAASASAVLQRGVKLSDIKQSLWHLSFIMLVPRRSTHWQQYGIGMHYTSTTLHQFGTRRWPLHYASSVMVCNHSSGPRTIRHFSSPLSASARFCTVARCSTLYQASISRLQRAVQCVLTRTGFLTDAIHHRTSPPLKCREWSGETVICGDVDKTVYKSVDCTRRGRQVARTYEQEQCANNVS